ncbi:hypothetical protein BJ138DRAFT_1017213, partial [Hygrophoropsis aurantiaca]
WDLLKTRGFVPPAAKSVMHEPRNGISLCDSHRCHFDGYRFFIRWVPAARVFVFVNFSQKRSLEQFHAKTVVLDPNHDHSPFPAPFLIQEMRMRGFYPWHADRPIPRPLSPTYSLVDCGGGAGAAGFGGGSGGAASPRSHDGPQEYLVLGNPFQDPALLESMRRQWQQLPNWKAATVEGLTWEGTAEENARKYIDHVGVAGDEADTSTPE